MTGGADQRDGVAGFDITALAAALEASPTPAVVTDPRRDDNPIVWANEAFAALTGYGREEFYGRNCRMLQGPDSDPGAVRRMHEAMAAGRAIACELLNYRKDGTPFWNGMTISPVRDAAGAVLYYFSTQADLTDKHRLAEALKRANDDLERQVNARTADLQHALEQKTALLHEVDHRVKNNLQVIFSLMLLKARRTPAGEARDALQGMADRIGALSTAHRVLYAAGDVTHFDIREFTADLLADLTAEIDAERIALATEIEPIACAAAMAAPLALLMHELAANAVRHAFPGERRGRVSIAVSRHGAGMHLIIADDGVGLAAGTPNPSGFGRSLVEMVARQLKGTVTWSDTAPGTRVAIEIPLDVPGNAS